MENWKPINGYEGIYEVSDLGNVRRFKAGKWSLLKPWASKRGYLQVSLSIKGKRSCPLLHRVVLGTFKGIQQDMETNHIDENVKNNCIENLEWVTPKENSHHGTRLKRIGEATSSRRKYRYLQLDCNKNLIRIIESKSLLTTNGFCPWSVRNAIKRESKHKGFYWKRESIIKN